MNTTSALALGLACLIGPAVANAHLIAVDQRHDLLDARPIASLVAEDAGRPGAHPTAGQGGSAIALMLAVDGVGHNKSIDLPVREAREGWTFANTRHGQPAHESDGDVGGSVVNQPLDLAPAVVDVTVPEPATLGLMGLGLLLIAFVSGRRGYGRRPFLLAATKC